MFALRVCLVLLFTVGIKSQVDVEDDDETLISNDGDDSNSNILIKKGLLPKQSKEAKMLFHSYSGNPFFDVMFKTGAINASIDNKDDPFHLLRDSYPLPNDGNLLPYYDYIIVGGGSAGSVLAARLSEDKSATVLLLEAGKPEMILTDIPMMAPYFSTTDYAWAYQMEYQQGVCMGSEDRRCYWPRGKALGGTSVINYMLYTRGRPEEWNQIAADGCVGWGYHDVLEYYKKSEKCELKKYRNMRYRGRDGELTIENPPIRTRLVEAFLAAGRLFGNPTVDYNAPDKIGFGYVQVTTNKGHRQSAAKAFLHRHKRRKNLHILTEATVTKVLIEPKSRRSYGVQYMRNGQLQTAKCLREVILSAGPIASPQLLMLSGIGPKERLQTLNIPIIQDLPVGLTLYDHVAFPGIVFKLQTTNASLLESKVLTLPNLMQWLQFGDGLLASPGSIEAIGYIKTPDSDIPPEIPDIELLSIGGSITSDSGHITRKSYKISDSTYEYGFSQLNNMDTWSVIPMLLHPKSKGYLELKDSNPFSHPKLYGRYLTHPDDEAKLLKAVRFIEQLAKSEPFKKFGPQIHYARYKGCENLPIGTDDYWKCAIRTMLITFNHQIGTCKMGNPLKAEDIVVDTELRVIGVFGLRVADSSIIPRTTSAHTHAPAVMIGEKAADMIKNTWLKNIHQIKV